MSVTLYQGDCLQELDRVADHSVHLICSDLPYGTTACSWDSVIPLEPLWAHFRRVLAPRGAVVLFGAQPFTSALVMSNPKWFRYEWIGDKVNRYTGCANANRMPLKRHENVLVFYERLPTYNKQYREGPAHPALTCMKPGFGRISKDKTTPRYRLANNGLHNPCSILPIKAINRGTEEGKHPTQKPLALLEYLLATYSNPGDTVLDCTFGSNTCGEAAVNLGRDYIGIERDPGYFAQGQARTDAAQARLTQLPLEGVT